MEPALNRVRFVDSLRIAVQDATVTGTISILSRPPGRKPDDELVALAEWFNGISFQDRQNLERVIEMTARNALFQILCVLDGAKAIEDRPDKGTLDLRYRRSNIDISLNDEAGAPLHELF